MAKKEIVERPEFQIKAMEVGIDTLGDLVEANLGGEGIDRFDLTRAVNPQGENIEWKIPGLEEEDEKIREVEGVIIFHRKVRVYYESEYKKGGGPPQCTSLNGRLGLGTPGGNCEECPFQVFGSGKNDGKACKEIKEIFMLRSGELLPTLFNITSVNFRKPNKYLLDLLSKRNLAFNHVITKIRLEPDVSAGGYDYARTDFSLVSVLPQEQRDAASALTKMFTKLLSTMSVVDETNPPPAEVSPEHAPDDADEVPY